MMSMVEEAMTKDKNKLIIEIQAELVIFKKDIVAEARTHAERITKSMHEGYPLQMLELKQKLKETMAVVDSTCSVSTQEEEPLNALS